MSRRRKQQVVKKIDSEELSPGEMLRAARESEGLGQHDVADALNLTHTVIQHLESDLYGELPGPAFSIGYLRAYAKFLGLDADKLVERVKEISQLPTDTDLVVHAVPVLDSVSEVEETSGLLPGSLLVGMVVLIGMMVWWFFFYEASGTQTPEMNSQVVSELLTPANSEVLQEGSREQKTLLLPQSAIPPQTEAVKLETRSVAQAIQSNAPPEVVSFEKTPENSPDESDLIQQLTDDQNSVAPASAPSLETRPVNISDDISEAPASAIRPSVYENGARRITREGNQLLEFNFSSDSWVGIQNSEMKTLYGDLNRAGTSLKLIGQGPFRILLGYAPGVRLTFNDVAVDLVSRTRNNVARVVVDQ